MSKIKKSIGNQTKNSHSKKYKYIVKAYNWKLEAKIERDIPIACNDTSILLKVGEWKNMGLVHYDKPITNILVPMGQVNCIHVM